MDDPLFDLESNTTSQFRVPRAAAPRERRRAPSCTRRPARSSASRGTCRSTRSTRSPRSTSTASPSTRPSSCTSCTTRSTGCAPSAVRLTNVFGPRQRLRDDLQGFLPIFVRRALADETITRVRRRRAGARLPLRRRRRRVPAARRARARRAGPDLQRRERRAPRRCGAIADAVVRGGRFGPGRARAVAARSRRDRHRLVLRRLVEGEADPRVGAAHVVRGRDRPDGRVLPARAARGTCDRRRSSPRDPGRRPRPPGGARSNPSSPRRSTASCARARTSSGPRLEAFEAEFAAFTGRRHAVGVASGTDALRLALVALGIGPGDEVIVPAFTAVPTAAAVCATGATPVFVDVDPDTADDRPERRGAAAVTDRTRAVIPVHLYGRPAPIPDLGVPVVEDAAQAHGAARPRVRIGRGGVQLLSHEEPRRDRRRWRGGHRRRRPGGERSASCARTGSPTDYVHTRGVDQRPAVRRRGGGAAGRAAPRSPPRTRVAARSRRATAPRRPTCGGSADHERHVYHLCVARVPDRERFAIAVPFDTGVHYPRALTQQPAYQEFVGRAVPGSRSVGSGVRIVPVLPRDDRRRDRGGVSSDPVNPAVEAISVFFPCYNDEATIAHDGPRRGGDARPRRRVRRRGHRHQRRLDRRLRRGARRAGGATSRCCASSPTSTTAATAARCSRASPRRRSSGSSTPTATASSIPPSSSCSCSTRPTTSTSCRATSCGAPTASLRTRHRTRVPPIREALLRAEDPRHRLRLPPHPPELRSTESTLVHTTGVICVELVRKLQDAGARFTEVGRAPLPAGARQVGVLPRRRHRPHALGPRRACGSQMVVLRRGRRAAASQRVATTTPTCRRARRGGRATRARARPEARRPGRARAGRRRIARS